MKKLIALDLDGTLLKNDHTISKNTKKYLKNIIKNNKAKVVITTGRTYTAAKRYHQELELDTPLISCNGSFIYDPIKKNIISGHPLNSNTLKDIFKLLNENKTFFQFYTADTIYSKERKYILDKWLNENDELPKERQINIKLINNPINYIKENDPIFKLLIIEEDQKKYKKIWTTLETFESIEIISSMKNAIDIMVKNISKGEALKFISNYYNIPLENTIAFGDNNNDATMLKTAGIGIAMENATLMAKNHANKTTLSNENDGIVEALKNIYN